MLHSLRPHAAGSAAQITDDLYFENRNIEVMEPVGAHEPAIFVLPLAPLRTAGNHTDEVSHSTKTPFEEGYL